MRIDILTLFPEMFAPLSSSILKRGVEKEALEINVLDIREFSKDKHKKCDDTPFGGGAGMLMSVQPIYDASLSVKDENAKFIFMSPRGRTLNSDIVKELASEKHLVLLCGHYEGVDERALELFSYEHLSIGDYVLTGGELASMVVVDSVARYVDGVISKESLMEESFSSGKLEYPQFTRPQEFMEKSVPEVLLSGNHKEIKLWREKQGLIITKQNRPDILKEKNEN